MASTSLRYKSRHLIHKSHHTLFNLSRRYSSSSNSDNDNHQQQSSNPTQTDEIPNNPNSDFDNRLGDTFRESIQKLQEKNVNNAANHQYTLTNFMETLPTGKSIGMTNPNRRSETARSLELRHLKELSKTIDSFRLRIKEDPRRR